MRAFRWENSQEVCTTSTRNHQSPRLMLDCEGSAGEWTISTAPSTMALLPIASCARRRSAGRLWDICASVLARHRIEGIRAEKETISGRFEIGRFNNSCTSCDGATGASTNRKSIATLFGFRWDVLPAQSVSSSLVQLSSIDLCLFFISVLIPAVGVWKDSA